MVKGNIHNAHKNFNHRFSTLVFEPFLAFLPNGKYHITLFFYLCRAYINSLAPERLEGRTGSSKRLEKALNKLMIERDSRLKHTDEHQISIARLVLPLAVRFTASVRY